MHTRRWNVLFLGSGNDMGEIGAKAPGLMLSASTLAGLESLKISGNRGRANAGIPGRRSYYHEGYH
ncbi:MAG: hypothetical protein NUV49_04235 [Patescibacteria group bacterium]|nr:hypothetical protein [Patescibacteria group bacterium]